MSFLTQVFYPLLIVLSTATSYQINVTSNSNLKKFLCDSRPLTEDTIVVLSTNITHIIDNVSFCIINTTYSLTLTSDSSLSAVVHCNGSAQPTTGFAFINVHNLTLHRLVWSGCGGYLNGINITKSATESPLYFPQKSAAAVVFLHIHILFIKEVNFTSYYGFAILAINPIDAMIHTIGVTKNIATYSQGSGILFLFADMKNTTDSSLNIVINQATVYNNDDSQDHHYCPSNIHQINSLLPVINAAGLTAIYTQKFFSTNFDLKNSHFYFNKGLGAVLIYHYNTTAKIQTKISNTLFSSNVAVLFDCLGISLSFFEVFDNQMTTKYKMEAQVQKLTVINSTFTKHGVGYGTFLKMKAVVFIHSVNPPNVPINISFNNITFSVNKAVESTCMWASTKDRNNGAKTKRLLIVLQNVSVYKNTALLSPFLSQ